MLNYWQSLGKDGVDKFFAHNKFKAEEQLKLTIGFINSLRTKIGDRNLRLLDVGCNGCREYPVYKQLGYLDYFGCDITPNCVAVAKERYPELACRIREGNVESLPYPDCSFDVVLCSKVLVHCHYFCAGLTELARVCNNGGACIIVPGYELRQQETVRQLNNPPVWDNFYAYKHVKRYLDGMVVNKDIATYTMIDFEDQLSDGFTKRTMIYAEK